MTRAQAAAFQHPLKPGQWMKSSSRPHCQHHQTIGNTEETTPMLYRLERCYFNGDKIALDTGLTLKEAQDWCNDPETSSRTCEGKAAKERSIARGPWFDAYYPA